MDYGLKLSLGNMDERLKNKIVRTIRETKVEGVGHEISADPTRADYLILFYQDKFASGIEIGNAAAKNQPMIIFSLEKNVEISQYGIYLPCQNETEIMGKLKFFLTEETLVKTKVYEGELWLKKKIRQEFKTEINKTIELLKDTGYEIRYSKRKTYEKGPDIMHYLIVKKHEQQAIIIGIKADEKTGIIRDTFMNITNQRLKELGMQTMGEYCPSSKGKEDLAEPFKKFNQNRLMLIY